MKSSIIIPFFVLLGFAFACSPNEEEASVDDRFTYEISNPIGNNDTVLIASANGEKSGVHLFFKKLNEGTSAKFEVRDKERLRITFSIYPDNKYFGSVYLASGDIDTILVMDKKAAQTTLKAHRFETYLPNTKYLGFTVSNVSGKEKRACIYCNNNLNDKAWPISGSIEIPASATQDNTFAYISVRDLSKCENAKFRWWNPSDERTAQEVTLWGAPPGHILTVPHEYTVYYRNIIR